MADAKQCDRCKKYYPYELSWDRDYVIKRSNVSTMDICPECYLKLLDFLGVKPTEEEKKKGKKK